ncbi:MAG: hypothetical protein WDO13_09490 [Verrucomicrobiota bacterium]
MLATLRAIKVINQLRDEGIISKYAIGGAVGAVFYIEPAQTQDIDVFIHLEAKAGSLLVSTGPITDRLRELGYTRWSEDRLVVEGWPVQFLPAGKLIEGEAIEAAVEMPLEGGVSAWVPPAEYLMAMAIDLGRPKDLLRLSQFHLERAYDPEKLKSLLERYDLVPKWERISALFESAGDE